MFKGFLNTAINNAFSGFSSLNYQLNNEAYGFSGCELWLDSSYGLNTQINLDSVNTWATIIGNNNYTQTIAGAQPIFILSDPTFNNNPIIYINSPGKGLISANGPNIKEKTLVLVYQYISNAGGGIYWQSRVIGDLNYATARSSGTSYSNGTYVASVAGFNWGGNYSYGSTSERNTNAKIVIINKNYWYSNGVSVIPDIGNYQNIVDFNLVSIGANNNAAFSGIFKISTIMLYNYNMTSNQIETLSSRLNSKYGLY